MTVLQVCAQVQAREMTSGGGRVSLARLLVCAEMLFDLSRPQWVAPSAAPFSDVGYCVGQVSWTLGCRVYSGCD
jgi:hypothetical protein